jgi:hypothetical protein
VRQRLRPLQPLAAALGLTRTGPRKGASHLYVGGELKHLAQIA